MASTMTKLDEFTKAYIECALWSTNDNSDPETGGVPLDENYDIEDIGPGTLARMVADCQDFQAKYADLIRDDQSRAGHDFWLTRNGHGAGFWDGDWEFAGFLSGQPIENVGEFLTEKSKEYGEHQLMVDNHTMIYGI